MTDQRRPNPHAGLEGFCSPSSRRPVRTRIRTPTMEAALDLSPLLLTLKVALLATLLAFAGGVAGGFVLARASFLGKETLDAILTLPMSCRRRCSATT